MFALCTTKEIPTYRKIRDNQIGRMGDGRWQMIAENY